MFTRVCRLETIPEGGMRLVIAANRHVILAWPDDGVLRAFQGVCPQSGTPLSEAEFDGTQLTCPSHFWTWDLNSGAPVAPQESALAQYPVRVEGGMVYVDADAAPERFAPR